MAVGILQKHSLVIQGNRSFFFFYQSFLNLLGNLNKIQKILCTQLFHLRKLHEKLKCCVWKLSEFSKSDTQYKSKLLFLFLSKFVQE